MQYLRSLLVVWITVLGVSCQVTPSGGGSRSLYGDRPGPKGFSTVIVDAGHGGHDQGARGGGHAEKRLALDVAERLRRELSPGFRVVMVRTSDRFIELDDRVRVANRYGNGVLVSIHLNHGARRRAGPETYYWRVDSYALARRIQNNLSATAPYESGNYGLVRRRLRLTRNPQIPCVLVECGYLSNSRERSLLTTPGYRQRLAKAIASAIRSQSAHGDSGMGPLPRLIYAAPSRASDGRG